MDGGITDEQANLWLQDIADTGFVSLHYESPGLQGVSKGEISGGGYTRFKMAWSQPSNRTIWGMVDARFTGLTTNKLTYFGIWNSLNKGRLMAYGPLPDINGVIVLNGQGYVLHEGDLSVSFG